MIKTEMSGLGLKEALVEGVLARVFQCCYLVLSLKPLDNLPRGQWSGPFLSPLYAPRRVLNVQSILLLKRTFVSRRAVN